jgi:hypothetical protein
VIMEKHKGRFYYVDHTAEHKYQDCKATVVQRLQNPLEGHLRADQVHANVTIIDDDADERRKEM